MTTATAGDVTPAVYDHKHKPYPLNAKPYRHPVTFTKCLVLRVVGGLGAVHVGTLAVVAIYYILFQTIAGVKYDWDNLFTGRFHLWGWYPTHTALLSDSNWTYYRHMVRGVGEGLLGGTLGQMMLVNFYKKYRPMNALDRLEVKLHVPNAKDVHEGRRLSTAQTLLAPLLILLYAAPGFAIGAGFVGAVHHWVDFHTAAPGAHASLWAYTAQIWTGTIDQKLVGLFASVVFGRRITKALGLSVQAWFAEQRRRREKGLRFYHWLSPTFMARYRGIPEHVFASAEAEGRHSGTQAAIITGGLTVIVALAIFGWYILAVIAR